MKARIDAVTDLLHRLGFPDSWDNIVGCVAWNLAEGGWWGDAASYNLFNTTQPEPGSRPINSVGVMAYPSYESGMQATITTLRNGYYPRILQVLRTNAGRFELAKAVQASPWGTGSGLFATMSRAEGEVGSPAPPPKPVPPLPPVIVHTGDNMKVITTSTGSLDANGDGYADEAMIPDATKVVSLRWNMQDPPTEGYHRVPQWGDRQEGGVTRLVFIGGEPGFSYGFTAYVLD